MTDVQLPALSSEQEAYSSTAFFICVAQAQDPLSISREVVDRAFDELLTVPSNFTELDWQESNIPKIISSVIYKELASTPEWEPTDVKIRLSLSHDRTPSDVNILLSIWTVPTPTDIGMDLQQMGSTRLFRFFARKLFMHSPSLQSLGMTYRAVVTSYGTSDLWVVQEDQKARYTWTDSPENQIVLWDSVFEDTKSRNRRITKWAEEVSHQLADEEPTQNLAGPGIYRGVEEDEYESNVSPSLSEAEDE